MLNNKDIFRKYDIRGIYGDALTDGVAENAAKAFAGQVISETGKSTPVISVGRDVRFSSETLFKSVCKGLTDSGVDVVDLGVCPSPLTYFSMYTENTDGYVMVTGSHNPPEFNGIKVGTKNTIYHSEKIQQIYHDIIEGDYCEPEKSGIVKKVDIIPAYISYMKRHFSKLKEEIAKLNKIKIVLDSGSGTASMVAPEIFRWLGVELYSLYCTPDGSFPGHHPDPTVEKNMQDAKTVLLENGAALAIGFDGDADRLGALNCKGEMLWGDQLLGIFASGICENHPGEKVVADVKASKGLYEYIENIGMKSVMYLSGHSMIKEKMKQEGAVLGGEMSAHFFFADRYFGYDDGIYASVRLLEVYVNKIKNGEIINSGQLDKLPVYFNTPEIRIPCPDNAKFELIKRLEYKFAGYLSKGLYGIKEIISIDGIRIHFEKGWALVRASNTEPLIVKRYEAETEDAFLMIMDFMNSKIKETEDDLQK